MEARDVHIQAYHYKKYLGICMNASIIVCKEMSAIQILPNLAVIKRKFPTLLLLQILLSCQVQPVQRISLNLVCFVKVPVTHQVIVIIIPLMRQDGNVLNPKL